jgi:acetoin utilization protein AcuB
MIDSNQANGTVVVRDYMSPFPYFVAPDTSLADANYLMCKQRIRHLPVLVDSELVGILTRSDILAAQPSEAIALKVWEQSDVLASLTVQKIMKIKPITVDADAPMSQAARLMLKHRISCLPIVNERRQLCGLLTETDVLRAAIEHWAPV